jgi:hypothetical protein
MTSSDAWELMGWGSTAPAQLVYRDGTDFRLWLTKADSTQDQFWMCNRDHIRRKGADDFLKPIRPASAHFLEFPSCLCDRDQAAGWYWHRLGCGSGIGHRIRPRVSAEGDNLLRGSGFE